VSRRSIAIGRSAAAGFLPIVGLLVACGPAVKPPPEITAISPDTVSSQVASSVTVEGKGFFVEVRTQLDSDAPPVVDGRFEVRLGETSLDSDSITHVDTEHLSLALPAGLPAGTHDVTVVTPGGQRTTRARGLTVQAGAVGLMISIEDAPGGTGAPIGASELQAGQVLDLYAALRTPSAEFVRDVDVTWAVAGGVGTVDPGPASLTQMTATTPGLGRVTAAHPEADDGVTGAITVSAGSAARLSIEDAPGGLGAAVGERSDLTTDDLLVLFAVARDAQGNFVADVTCSWEASGGIGALDPGPASSTILDLDRPGVGRVTARHDTLPFDETGNLLVAAGDLVRARIESSPGGTGSEIATLTLGVGVALEVYAVGYDADDNYAGEAAATWSVTGTIGAVDPTGPAPQTTFTADAPGVGQIVATTAGALDDSTGDITVAQGAIARVSIEDAPDGLGSEVGALSLSTDEQLVVYAVGRDLGGNFTSNEPVTWSVSGGTGSITGGLVSQATFDPMTVGAGTISAVHATAPGDLTGTITVLPGALAQVVIESAADGSGVEVGDLALTVGDSTTLHAVGRDADGNLVDLSASSVTWSGTGAHAGVSGTGEALTLNVVQVGLGQVSVDVAGFNADPDDTTGTISVAPAPLAAVFIEDAADGSGVGIGDLTLVAGEPLLMHAVGRGRLRRRPAAHRC